MSTSNPPPASRRVQIYDTTLRDGTQLEGISLTVDDKLRIAEKLDHLGVAFIEGGWPGANPKDDEFFDRAGRELDLKVSELVAFGSTRRAKGRVDSDQILANLAGAGTSTVCLVGKCWDYHVTEALQTTLDEGVAMVEDSVAFLVSEGLRVMFDAEHFFDGFRGNPEFSMRVLEAAAMAGASTVVLCDTNGGAMPDDISEAVAAVAAHLDCEVGVHMHNDTGCGVANALAAVKAGAVQVQGTINGYGERVGNCDLVPIIANLELKMGVRALPDGRLQRLTSVSHHVAELVNFPLNPQQPYVGAGAFAHKAGLHTSALNRRPDAYEHVSPESVGNGTRVLVSEMAGRSTLEMRSAELGLELDGAVLGEVVDTLKRLEHAGYHFEAADASLELLMRGAAGWEQPYFQLESFRVSMDHRSGTGARAWNEVTVDVDTEATVKLWANGSRRVAVGEGNGPVNALDTALRCALADLYPALANISLADYKVRVLDTQKGTGAVTRVLIDSTDRHKMWTTIGVSENIIEASWQALADSVVYGLLHADH
ncbi:MAG: citramalate synthase [Acidimicrobiaceae bacterium]|nr:citramalate synthase [Acidimicrobiaceae bacterium]MCY4175599.1 citramalate synthase [Acidimicrobiaceae bacterium]MCY4294998.1 citramalate synthase [Acidimicrobiaceae bacterium]